MACRKAIIASAAGETERIIKVADCGICVKTGDPQALAEQIAELLATEDWKQKLNTFGQNAEAYFLKHFVKADLMDEMMEFIEA